MLVAAIMTLVACGLAGQSVATTTFLFMLCFAALGAGNGALLQLVPLRWPVSTAMAGSMTGEIDAPGGGFIPNERGQRRSMRVVPAGDGTRLDGFMLAGDISAEAWVKPFLQDELLAQAYGRLLLVPDARAPVAVAARGKQVCSCFDGSESQLKAALDDCTGPPDARLLHLQDRLKCGSNCGSCVPELKRLVRVSQQVA